MSTFLKTEIIALQVKDRLNQERVKLWLEPYYEKGVGCVESEIKNLAEKYSSALGIDENNCLTALKDLQRHALERLNERSYFLETGIATFKVRYQNENKRVCHVSLSMKLTASGQDLIHAVAEKIGETSERLKLIFNGCVIKQFENLELQKLQNGSQLMCLFLRGDSLELKETESRYRLLETTKADAKLLAGKSNSNSDYYLQITDQSGKSLDLPSAERDALVVAMSLHEKGRAAMKKDDYALALLMLLEADKEFSICQSEILRSVDNYALLNLDIAWCYLCLQNVAQIPDAEERLRKSEESFHRSYGHNLERLLFLKGTSGNEAALFMRLHLLQAIVLFHKNKHDSALVLFKRVQDEIKDLKVDDDSLMLLIEMGYSSCEARLALRATRGDVASAVEYIKNQQEKLQEQKKKDRAERKLNRERHVLGYCIDGKTYVEPSLLRSLIEMGYSCLTAKEALHRTNNDVALSIELIHKNPNLMFLNEVSKLSEQQIEAMGFMHTKVKKALKKHNGDMDKALTDLLADSQDSDDSDEDTSNSRKKAREQEEEAYKRLSEGISSQEHDEYLDLNLAQEENFLKEYMSFLTKK